MNKIALSLRKMRVIKNQPVLLAFSGGKDSIVCLDLASQVFSHIECFYFYLVKGLSFVEAPLEFAKKKYDIKIHYVPSIPLIEAYRYGIYMPHYKEFVDIPALYYRDAENYIRLKTGIQWIIYGLRRTDSWVRRAILKKIDMFDLRNRKLYPVSDFTADEIRTYLNLRNIPLPEQGGKRSFGVDLQVSTLKFIYANYPDDFKLIKKKFPFCEAVLKREEYHAKENEIPKV
jgi:phosphoadenosine phosphosulfate reductase